MGRKKDEDSITEVKWEQPPEGATYDWTAIANQLRENPLKWAKVFEKDRVSVSNAVRQGSVMAVHPDLGFEVRTANNTREPPRTCTLYLRWNPDRVKDELRETIRTSRQKGT